MRTAFISTYPPRRSGLATFTQALAAATGERVVVALQPPDQELPYPFEVAHRIRRDDLSDYIRVAQILNRRVDVVSVQHDFSIWGGEDGSFVLDLVRALDVPAVTTLHDVSSDPFPHRRAILTELVERSAATVVMCQPAATTLVRAYGLDASRIKVVPHGVPDLPLVDPAKVKPTLGLAGREIILGIGLLSPDMGVELTIDALPAVVAAHPTAVHVVLGPTRPSLLGGNGDSYREALIARARRLGVGDHVRFFDRFAGRVELTHWLQAADIFVTPYPDLDRAVSGTLSYAMGAGRPIVSSPYAYAVDLLAGGRGVLVAPDSPGELAAALVDLLDHPEERAALGQRAYDHGRRMVWSEIGAAYRRILERVVAEAASARPPASLTVARA